MSPKKKKRIDNILSIMGGLMFIFGINLVAPAMSAGLIFWSVAAMCTGVIGLAFMMLRLTPKYIDWIIED